MLAPPRQSYLGAVAATVYIAARSLLNRSGIDLSRWGGAAADRMSSKIPTETDPQNPDYSSSISAPRALHAIDPMRIAAERAKQLAAEEKQHGTEVELDSKRSRRGRRTTSGRKTASEAGHALLFGKPAIKINLSTLICWAVIDSGCSWHCHPHAKDLINGRPCNDTMTGIDGKPQKVTCIGDLPALTRDHLGVWRRIIIKNVRCVPTFSDTLISADQFWEKTLRSTSSSTAPDASLYRERGTSLLWTYPSSGRRNCTSGPSCPPTDTPRCRANRRRTRARSRQPFTVRTPRASSTPCRQTRHSSYYTVAYTSVTMPSGSWARSPRTSPQSSPKDTQPTANTARPRTPLEYRTPAKPTRRRTWVGSSTATSQDPSSVRNTASSTSSSLSMTTHASNRSTSLRRRVRHSPA